MENPNDPITINDVITTYASALGVNDGGISFNVNGGSGNYNLNIIGQYNYLDNSGNCTINKTDSGYEITNLQAGYYKIIIVDDNDLSLSVDYPFIINSIESFTVRIYDSLSDWLNKNIFRRTEYFHYYDFSLFHNETSKHIEIDISNVTNFSTNTLDYPVDNGDTKFVHLESLRIITNNTNVGLTSDINTSDNTGFNNMFKNSNKLARVDFSDFRPKIINMGAMGYMFDNCSSLTNIDLTSFNPDSIGNDGMGGMFSNCSNLTSVDLSSFNPDTINEQGLFSLFANCTSLTNVNLTSLDPTNTIFGTNWETEMFLNTNSNLEISIHQNWSISSVNGVENNQATYNSTIWTLDNGAFYVPHADAYGDPYIQPLHGDIYKLPDRCAAYRLLQDTTNQIFVNATVDTLDQSEINKKVKIIEKEYFNGQTLPNIYNFTQMYFFTTVSIFYNNEYWTYDLIKQHYENKPDWLHISAPKESLYNSRSGIYQNEPTVLRSINIDNKLHLTFAWFMNPQINSGISVQATNTIDGLLVHRYKSTSAMVKSLEDVSVKRFITANERESVYLNETFYPHNSKMYNFKIAVI